MSMGILTSTLQTLKSIKDIEYVQRLQDITRNITSGSESDFSHVGTRKTRAQLIRLSAAVCGIELCYAAETAFVSPILLKLGVPVAFMTLVWCVSPLLGFFLVPITGSLSDRCPLKLGRRRPFILMYSVGIILGLILVPNGEYFGFLAGDAERKLYSKAPINEEAVIIKKINATNSLVKLGNGSTEIVRSGFSPEWPSVVTLPHKHVIGILLTILGVALLDFNCDAMQSPCRTYLLDISVPEDHSRGLTSFTVVAGVGGSFGYLIGGIDWEATSFAAALGGHIKVVFIGVLVLFIVCVILTMTSFKEIPLSELGASKEELQKNVKKVKKAKYRKFVNESSEDEYEINDRGNVGSKQNTYGSLNRNNETPPSIPNDAVTVANEREKNGIATTTMNNIGSEYIRDGPVQNKNTNILAEKDDHPPEKLDKPMQFDSIENVPLKTYLRSIVKMPRSIFILCLTNLFCWMSLVCYSLYFTDFVGQSVYGGDPKAPVGTREHDLYFDGVRLGSFGMSLYSLSCAIYSLFVEYLVQRYSARNVYMYGQLVYTVGMILMAIFRHPVAVILLSPTAGIMYATLFTMPYLLVAHYHASGRFCQTDTTQSTDIRGLGTDVALVSSMVFLAQFLLSLFMGSLVHLAGTTVTIVIAASVLSCCGSLSASQVTYLDL